MQVNDLFVIELTSGEAEGVMTQPFQYRVTSFAVGDDVDDIPIAFGNGVVNPLRDITSVQTEYMKMYVYNLLDLSEFTTFNWSPFLLGQRASATIPQFNAISFTAAIPQRGQKPASKRFGYIAEDDTEGGFVTGDLTYRGFLDALASALSLPLILPNGTVLSPVVIKRIKYITPKGNDAYRFPNPSDPSPVSFPAVGWTWDEILTSQITRKLGRGI